MKKRVVFSSLVLLGAAKVQAAYDPNDDFNAYVGVSSRYDSNLFREDSGREDQDFIADLRAGLMYDRQWSKQHFNLSFDANAPRYSEHSELNHQAWKGSAAWDWQVGKRLSGTLSYRDSKTFADFAEVSANNTQKQKDLIRDRVLSLSAGYVIGHNWQILVMRQSRDVDHSAAVRVTSDQKNESTTVSFAFLADTGHRLSAYSRWSDIDYDEGINVPRPPLPAIRLTAAERNLRQHELGINGTWQYSPKTKMTLQVGRVSSELTEEEKAARGIRDYETTVGHADISWQATAKTKINVFYDRQAETGAETLGRNISDTFGTRLDWALTAKTNTYVTGRYLKRDYGVSEAGSSLNTDNGETENWNVELGLNTRPVRALSLSGYVNYSTQDTTYSQSSDYDAIVAGLGASWWF